MAVKKTASETDKLTTAIRAETPVAAADREEILRLVYIGPTLDGGRLKSNNVFVGTEADIKEALKEIIEEYPVAERLLVPVSQLADKKYKARTEGNIMNKFYSDMVSLIEAHRKTEV